MSDFVIENGVLLEYKGEGGNVVIPEGIAEIGDFSFSNCSTLISVEIPSGVTIIGENAFEECANLSAVILPESVKEIREEAFIRCPKLADQNGFAIVKDVLYGYYGTENVVTIPAGITKICSFAFEGANIVSVSIPDGVTYIGIWAFSKCTMLEAVTIPQSVKHIGMGAFCDCESLTAVTIPTGVQKLNMHVFQNCKSLKTVIVPVSVKCIGESAFQGCTSLKSICVPESLTDIERRAFADCTELADQDGFVIINNVLYDYFGQALDVKIPAGIKKISRFYIHDRKDCVVSVLIPDSVTEIGKEAFGWYGAFRIIIPASVTAIGEDALSCGYRTICVFEGSYAETYAKENEIPYVVI